MAVLGMLDTTLGGIKAVTWAYVQQMAGSFGAGMALGRGVSMRPPAYLVRDAVRLAGAAGQ